MPKDLNCRKCGKELKNRENVSYCPECKSRFHLKCWSGYPPICPHCHKKLIAPELEILTKGHFRFKGHIKLETVEQTEP